ALLVSGPVGVLPAAQDGAAPGGGQAAGRGDAPQCPGNAQQGRCRAGRIVGQQAQQQERRTAFIRRACCVRPGPQFGRLGQQSGGAGADVFAGGGLQQAAPAMEPQALGGEQTVARLESGQVAGARIRGRAGKHVHDQRWASMRTRRSPRGSFLLFFTSTQALPCGSSVMWFGAEPVSTWAWIAPCSSTTVTVPAPRLAT